MDTMLREAKIQIERGESIDVGPVVDFLRSHKIGIYGAGKCGVRLGAILRQYGVSCEYYLDKNADNIGVVNGAKVYRPESAPVGEEDKREWYIIASAGNDRNIHSIMRSAAGIGFAKFINGHDLQYVLSARTCQDLLEKGGFRPDVSDCCSCIGSFENCRIFRSAVARMRLGDRVRPESECDRLLRQVHLVITKRCTLRCKDCVQCLSDYTMQKDLPAKRLLQDVVKLLEVAGFITTAGVVGGEPLLHHQFVEIMSGLLELDRIGVFTVLTNGTVLPDDAVINILRNERVLVLVSGYGANLPPGLRHRPEEFIEAMRAHSISYIYSTSLTWYEFGGYECRNRSADELGNIFSRCDLPNIEMSDGKMFHCPRSVAGYDLSLYGPKESEYVDIRDSDVETIRSRLMQFSRLPYITACNHCNSPLYAGEVKAGEQKSALRRGVKARQ